MAVRLRYNGLRATLAAALTATTGNQTITFTAPLTYNGGVAVPTLGAADYLVLTLLDPVTGLVSEIVTLNVYTQGATTGTIGRAQESTSAVVHNIGDQVVHDATSQDFANTLPFKDYVRMASTGNLAVATGGALAVDGFNANPGDRILVKDQTTQSQNGIYIAAAGAWTRAVDFGQFGISAASVGVAQGTVNGGGTWSNVFKATDSLGSTAMPWMPVLAVASGTVTTAAPGAVNTPVSVAVTFPVGRFPSPPNVVCTPGAGAPQTVQASFSALTNTGVTIWGSRSSGTLNAISINWIAIAQG